MVAFLTFAGCQRERESAFWEHTPFGISAETEKRSVIPFQTNHENSLKHNNKKAFIFIFYIYEINELNIPI